MSSIYKGSRIVSSTNSARVIDSNEKVMLKLEAIREKMMAESVAEEGFVSGLQAEAVEVLVDEEPEDGLTAEQIEKKARADAKELLYNAKNESDNIINAAQVKAKEIHSEAEKQGYAEGYKKAMDELAKKEKEQQVSLEKKKLELEKEYEELKKQIEPQLVDALLTVFSRVTHTMADSNKDTIMHLVEGVMRNSEISKDFLIKVSKEDYQFMINNKDKLYEHVSKNVRIEIYQDMTLKRNQCIIETDAGVFDCSLDIQLENLIKEIRILSCLVD